jgi:hypothetical protein
MRTLVASCLACTVVAGCSDDTSSAAARSDTSGTQAQLAAYSGGRFTPDEASALATLSHDGGRTVYREVPDTRGFVVSGVIEASGAFSRDTLVQPTHDQRVCRPFRDVITPQQRNAVGNAIVWIAGITSGKSNALPRRTSVRLSDCRLEPRVHVIAQGGTVLVGSSDAMESRLRMTDVLETGGAPRAIIPLHDFGQVVPNADIASKAGLVEISDDRHPWVRGYIVVSPHPYIAVTTASGTFQFTDVPAGRHELIVFSEALGTMRRIIDVRSDTQIQLKYAQ